MGLRKFHQNSKTLQVQKNLEKFQQNSKFLQVQKNLEEFQKKFQNFLKSKKSLYLSLSITKTLNKKKIKSLKKNQKEDGQQVPFS